MNKLSLVGMQLPGQYKENFDVRAKILQYLSPRVRTVHLAWVLSLFQHHFGSVAHSATKVGVQRGGSTPYPQYTVNIRNWENVWSLSGSKIWCNSCWRTVWIFSTMSLDLMIISRLLRHHTISWQRCIHRPIRNALKKYWRTQNVVPVLSVMTTNFLGPR
jgi:hypothetical protein